VPALELLAKLGVHVKPKKVIGIYGPPMVGKSVLAGIVAGEYAGDEGRVFVVATERHYFDDDYMAMIRRYLPKNAEVKTVLKVDEVFKTLYALKNALRKDVTGKRVVILDSLSFVALDMSAYYFSTGLGVRPASAQIIPVINALSAMLKSLAVSTYSLAIAIMHAGSTAGAGKFRGITGLKPSMSMRAGHAFDYLLQLDMDQKNRDNRILTVVANRVAPETEGSSIKIRFVGKTIEPVVEEEAET